MVLISLLVGVHAITAGSNRVNRIGLEGTESALFYDNFRILDLVKAMAPRFQ